MDTKNNVELELRYVKGVPLLRYIIPFTYNQHGKTYEEAVRNLLNNEWQKCSRGDIVPFNEEDLYEHVYRSLLEREDSEGNKSNLGGIFKPIKNTRKNMFYHYHKLNEKGDDEKEVVSFSIVDEGIFIFKTGISFYWYEIRLSEMMIDEVVLFQNRFKELNTIHYTKSVNDKFRFSENNKKSENCFTMGNMIAEKLRKIFCDVYYYPPRVNKVLIDKHAKKEPSAGKLWSNMTVEEAYHQEDSEDLPVIVPDRALLFGYFVFQTSRELASAEEKKAVLNKTAENTYYLSRGYKHSYKVSENAEAEKQNMYFRHENDIWDASLEGVACVVSVYEDIFDANGQVKSNTFYDHTRVAALKGNYFLLYMLLLYQHYTLVVYCQRVSREISLNVKDYENGAENLYRKIHQFKLEVDVFMASSQFGAISHTTDMCRLYDYIADKLMIRKDTEQLKSSIDRLDALQGTLLDKIKQDERETEEDNKNFFESTMTKIAGYFGLFALVSVIVDMIELADIMKKWFSWSQAVYVISLICGGVLIMIPLGLCIKTYVDYVKFTKGRKNS